MVLDPLSILGWILLEIKVCRTSGKGEYYLTVLDYMVMPRALFLHVSLPGQVNGAEDLPRDFIFPSMEVMACKMQFRQLSLFFAGHRVEPDHRNGPSQDQASGGAGGWCRGKYHPQVCHEPSRQGTGGAGHQHGGSGHCRV